jgi:WD40 repeat protein
VIRSLTFGLLLSLASVSAVRADDWPMWRHDARHSGVSTQPLAEKLYLQWVREIPKQKTAWPDQPLLVHDRVPEPVVLGTTLFFGSVRDDTLTAIETRTGLEKWVFAAEGPIRFAPVAWQDRVFIVSDDGYLYCVEAATGKLFWKFRGGPSDRKILGNGRLISTWPARGAPVVADNTVYFAASIWPFMGIFIHALDTRTGSVIWTNDGDGSMYIKQPHNADSFAGVAPQGTLTVHGDKLLVPGGRSVPACYDRATGKLIHYKLAENSKLGGGPDIAVVGRLFFNGGAAFELETGGHLGSFAKFMTAGEDLAAGYSNGKVRVLDVAKTKIEFTESVDRRGAKVRKAKWTPAEVGSFDGPKVVEAMIRAGDRLYFGSPGEVGCLELPRVKDAKPAVIWKAAIEGTPCSLIAADDRLFAVTLEGRMYCFGAEEITPRTHKLPGIVAVAADVWTRQAQAIIDTSKVRDGYCVAWGVGSGRLIMELLRQSNLHIIVLERDPDVGQRFRQRMSAAGLYGERVAVHGGEPIEFPLPPYLATLMVAEEAQAVRIDGKAAFLRKMFESLRPYGGVAFLPVQPAVRRDFIHAVATAKLANARVSETSDWLLLTREGALPGAANWTHEHADASNTRVSHDQLVMAPLGLLWFGGSANTNILPRHGHGPQPQVVDGRLLIEGMDVLRAVDIYTGRVLWEANVPGLGKFYNNMLHQPGANATGTNYVSTPDGIYVVSGKACLRLDPATGRLLEEFHLPTAPKAKVTPPWGYVNVYEDYLVGGADPLLVDLKDDALPRQLQLWDVAGQKVRFVLEGHTDYVTSVAFSPDGTLLATASNDKTVRLWHTTTGRLKATLHGHEKRVNCLVFAPDGKSLASGSDDHTVLIWHVDHSKPQATLKAHTESVICLAFSPDGKTLVSGASDASVKMWDVADHRLVASFEDLTDDVTCLAYAPDGKTLAAGSADATIKLWDVESGQVRAVLNRQHDAADTTCLAFTHDGATIATGGKDKRVHLWDVKTGKHLAALDDTSGNVRCLAFSADDRTLAAGTFDATIHLWDVEKRETTANLKGQPGSARSVAFAPDGKTLAMGGTEVWSKTQNESLSSSKQLVVMNRKTGEVLWTVAAKASFRHNAICMGGGRLYAIDRLSGGELARLKRRGIVPRNNARIVAYDLKTGQELWSFDEEVFGTWLSYSEQYDVLVEAGRMARDTLYDEPRGMRAFQGTLGVPLWQNKTYGGPAMIHGDTILKDQSACELLTGKPKMRRDPVTGQEVEWTWTRDYGCNTPAAAEHLMTFRSGAAGYFDLKNDGGTGNFGGFRSSCTNNLIVAGGLLNAPDYTRTCTCSYQNQTSLALVPMPEVEMWTRFPVGKAKAPTAVEQLQRFFGYEPPRVVQPIQHLALNIGAPGCRRAPDGRLWLNEHEQVELKFEKFGFYSGHSAKIVAPPGTLPWVGASGCRGITGIQIVMKSDKAARYTVRLHFADPDNDKAGERAFDVTVQSKAVLEKFDIVKEAGGRNRVVMKEFKGIEVKDRLTLGFTGTGTEAASVPLLCGLELVREGD